jgi:hypothetical protein
MRGREVVFRGRATRFSMVVGLLAAALALTALPAGATGGHRVTDSKDGFLLVLPPGWNQIALTGSKVGSLLGAGPEDPSIKAILAPQAQSAAAKGLKFYAVALSQLNGTFLPVINVGIFKGSGSKKILDPEVKGFAAEAGGSSITVKNVTLRLGPAVETTYVLVSKSGSPAVWETQVYAPHSGKIYVATFSALTQPAVELTAAVVMGSWRFTK